MAAIYFDCPYSFLYLFVPPHPPLMSEHRSGYLRQRASSATGFRGINRSIDRSAALPFRVLTLKYRSLRPRAPTPSNFALLRGKSRSLAHLFHVPLAPPQRLHRRRVREQRQDRQTLDKNRRRLPPQRRHRVQHRTQGLPPRRQARRPTTRYRRRQRPQRQVGLNASQFAGPFGALLSCFLSRRHPDHKSRASWCAP